MMEAFYSNCQKLSSLGMTNEKVSWLYFIYIKLFYQSLPFSNIKENKALTLDSQKMSANYTVHTVCIVTAILKNNSQKIPKV